MSAEIKSHIVDLLTRALAQVAPEQPGSLISLERPKQAQHGDFSSPLAMQLARKLLQSPAETAQALVRAVPPSEWVTAEFSHPGFINFEGGTDRKSTRLNSSHSSISYAVFCLKK